MTTPLWSVGGAYSVFPYLAKLFGLTTFIETGCAFADMVVHLYPTFDKLYTIEKSDWHYRVSEEILRDFSKITLIHGDSAVELPKLLESIPDTPTLFWLDAHGEAGKDAGPIAEELLTVTTLRPNALIAIDDVGRNRHHDVNLSKVTAKVSLDDWTKDYRFGRVLFLHKGQFNIPDFGD